MAQSVGDGLPDQFGHVDHKLGASLFHNLSRTHLTDANADDILRRLYRSLSLKWETLPTTAGAQPGPTITVQFHHDGIALIGADRTKVRTNGPSCVRRKG